MKLGALLLKSFRSHSHLKVGINRVLKAQTRGKTYPKSATQSPSHPSPSRAHGKLKRVPKAETALLPQVLERPDSILSTSQMIRPDGVLRASIEATVRDPRYSTCKNYALVSFAKNLQKWLGYSVACPR